MTALLTPGNTVSPLTAGALITEPQLILYADIRLDIAIVIPTTVRHSSGRYYFRGYSRFKYTAIAEALDLDAPVLTQLPFKPRLVTMSTDDDLDRRFKRRGQKQSTALQKLALRWSLIQGLVTGPDAVLLFDPEQMRELVRRYARTLADTQEYKSLFLTGKRTKKAVDGSVIEISLERRTERLQKEILRLLNQFWAGGSTRGALIGFEEFCGGKGKRKSAGSKKRGAPKASSRTGETGKEGLNILENSDHAKIIKFCYDTYVIRGTTEMKALRRMWTDFYSVDTQQADGSTNREWQADHLRPTRTQFRYWGTQETAELTAWRKQLPPAKFDKSYRALLGNATDDIFAVGQRGGIDSSPPDIQFVRALDRLARVGGGHRVLIADSTFGYIPGLYMGYDPPSAKTVRIAIYNAMDPDKQRWLDDLGLALPAEDFIPIWFASFSADNTDLRCEEIKTCAEGIGTSIHFMPVLRSDLNGVIENTHHKVHRLVDHNMLGTTHGQQRTERGEASATIRARHTMIEATRETVRAIWTHNTMEIDVRRPLRMRLKGVPPTRLHMTQELIRQGKVARTAHAVDLARRHLLPRHPGTFTAKGVRLHRLDTGDKVCFLDRVRYVSDHPVFVTWCEMARRGGKHDPEYFRATFIVVPYQIGRIWYLDSLSGEAIELGLRMVSIKDPDLEYEMTLQDLEDGTQIESAERGAVDEAKQRKLGAMEAQQRNGNRQANDQYEDAVIANGGEPSKAEMRANKRVNREEEKRDTFFGIPVPEAVYEPSAESASEESQDGSREATAGEARPDRLTLIEQEPRIATESKEQGAPVPTRKSLLRAALAETRNII